ncbi:hypothetical protein A2U01_0071951, partial [Trifolium medium]|nr:hypothetical protein [Trifolium medium]
ISLVCLRAASTAAMSAFVAGTIGWALSTGISYVSCGRFPTCRSVST